MIILDAVERLEIPDNKGLKNEFNAINRLVCGLTLLYKDMKKHEGELSKSHSHDSTFVCMGENDEYNRLGININHLCNCFDWYSVTALKLFALIGHIYKKKVDSAFKISAYVKKTGNIKKYRDKVAAHYANVDPRPDDNEADMFMSILPNLGFSSSRFYFGLLQISRIKAGNTTPQTHDLNWSLTEFHESQLQIRCSELIKSPVDSGIVL